MEIAATLKDDFRMAETHLRSTTEQDFGEIRTYIGYRGRNVSSKVGGK